MNRKLITKSLLIFNILLGVYIVFAIIYAYIDSRPIPQVYDPKEWGEANNDNPVMTGVQMKIYNLKETQ